jgi:hypothetical protein
MFHPVGPQPPSVYWRRRLVLLGATGLLLVMLILTVKVATSKGSAAPHVAGPTAHIVTTPAGGTFHTTTTHPPAPRHGSSSSSLSGSPSHSSPAPPAPCAASALDVAAVSSKPNYSVGDEPVLELQVTNKGTASCVQDLADSQIELKVYNGESRVWDSHDCQIEPGTNDMTLEVGKPVRVAITWSGLSSQPHCAGTRQRVGAGTYTLYAALSGHTGKATQFTIS